MQSTNDKILKKWKNILSILLAVLLMNQGIVAEAAPGAQTAISNVKSSSVEITQDTEAQESNLQKPSDTEITKCMHVHLLYRSLLLTTENISFPRQRH